MSIHHTNLATLVKGGCRVTLGRAGNMYTVHFLEDDPDPSKRFGTDTIAQQAAHDHDEPVP
jgi:hypothetical protein